MAAVAAEALEGEEAGAAFEGDSKQNASSKGVNLDKLKLIGDGIKLATEVYQLVRLFVNSSKEKEDRKRKRYSAGVLYKDENRKDLIRKNLLPVYYSDSNIIKLLRNNILPYGWSMLTAVNQGFGEEISAGKFRKKNVEESTRLKKEGEREKKSRLDKIEFDLFNRGLRNKKIIEIEKPTFR